MYSDYYDQAFFDGYVTLRNAKYNIFSLNIHYLFVCEESLNINLTGVNFSTNDFVQKTHLIPGKFNIGKWYRNLDCGFVLNDNHKELNIEKGKEYCYVNFQTDEKVNLKKFYLTDKIKKMISGEIIGMKNYKKEKSYSLEHSYEMFEKSQLRKYMLKEIRKNTLE